MMTHHNTSRLPHPNSIQFQRLCLRLVVRPGEQVLSDLSQIIQRYTSDSSHLMGVIDDNMRLSVDLIGIHPHRAENLARALIRHNSVTRLSGQCFDSEGQETYAVKLYST